MSKHTEIRFEDAITESLTTAGGYVLGDPEGLMLALEDAFSEMAQQHGTAVFDSETPVLG